MVASLAMVPAGLGISVARKLPEPNRISGVDKIPKRTWSFTLGPMETRGSGSTKPRWQDSPLGEVGFCQRGWMDSSVLGDDFRRAFSTVAKPFGLFVHCKLPWVVLARGSLVDTQPASFCWTVGRRFDRATGLYPEPINIELLF